MSDDYDSLIEASDAGEILDEPDETEQSEAVEVGGVWVFIPARSKESGSVRCPNGHEFDLDRGDRGELRRRRGALAGVTPRVATKDPVCTTTSRRRDGISFRALAATVLSA